MPQKKSKKHTLSKSSTKSGTSKNKIARLEAANDQTGNRKTPKQDSSTIMTTTDSNPTISTAKTEPSAQQQELSFHLRAVALTLVAKAKSLTLAQSVSLFLAIVLVPTAFVYLVGYAPPEALETVKQILGIVSNAVGIILGILEVCRKLQS